MPDQIPQVPVLPLSSLPSYTGSLSDNTRFVAILDNTRTVKVPWASISSGTARIAQAPDSPASAGESGQIAVDSTGLYSFHNGWGKSPRYTGNWDDLTATTRFLRVDAPMALSASERGNALESLSLGPAGAGVLGLVMPGEADTEGTYAAVSVSSSGAMTVPYATATVPGSVTIGGTSHSSAATQDSVNAVELIVVDAIRQFAIPPATATTIGGVMSDPDGTFVVDSNGVGSVPVAREGSGEPGLVRVGLGTPVTPPDPQHPEDTTQAATIERVLYEIGAGLDGMYTYYATPSRAGLVRPDGAAYLTDTSASETGAFDVRAATSSRYGAVFVIDTMDEVAAGGRDSYTVSGEQYRVVPTASAVESYVTEEITSRLAEFTIDVSKLPVADDNGSLGVMGVKPVAAGGTGSIAISGGFIDIVVANWSGQPGVVKVRHAQQGDDILPATVPTVIYMEDYVGDAISAAIGSSSLSWPGGETTNTIVATGGITTPNITGEPTDPEQVLNWSQVVNLASAAVPASVLTAAQVAKASSFFQCTGSGQSQVCYCYTPDVAESSLQDTMVLNHKQQEDIIVDMIPASSLTQEKVQLLDSIVTSSGDLAVPGSITVQGSVTGGEINATGITTPEVTGTLTANAVLNYAQTQSLITAAIPASSMTSEEVSYIMGKVDSEGRLQTGTARQSDITDNPNIVLNITDVKANIPASSLTQQKVQLLDGIVTSAGDLVVGGGKITANYNSDLESTSVVNHTQMMELVDDHVPAHTLTAGQVSGTAELVAAKSSILLSSQAKGAMAYVWATQQSAGLSPTIVPIPYSTARTVDMVYVNASLFHATTFDFGKLIQAWAVDATSLTAYVEKRVFIDFTFSSSSASPLLETIVFQTVPAGFQNGFLSVDVQPGAAATSTKEGMYEGSVLFAYKSVVVKLRRLN